MHEAGCRPAGAAVVAAYDQTAAGAGNVPATATIALAGADDDLNRALLGRDTASVQAKLAQTGIRALRSASGGADAEGVERALGRAAANLWAHERLVELARAPEGSLESVEPGRVARRAAP